MNYTSNPETLGDPSVKLHVSFVFSVPLFLKLMFPLFNAVNLQYKSEKLGVRNPVCSQLCL